MKVAILQFPGTNCEYDTQYALNKLGAKTTIVWHKDTALPKDINFIVLAGGFSYGDYLRCGAIAKFSPIMNSVIDFAKNGGHVLGICNGFQILTEIGLLPGALKRNDKLHFISRHHKLKVISNNNSFLNKFQINETVNIPMAHHDGSYYIDKVSLEKLYDNDQVLLKYVDQNNHDASPNGSVDSIAGICNKDKNIYGLMPHPERAMEKLLGSDDGVKMLEGFLARD